MLSHPALQYVWLLAVTFLPPSCTIPPGAPCMSGLLFCPGKMLASFHFMMGGTGRRRRLHVPVTREPALSPARVLFFFCVCVSFHLFKKKSLPRSAYICEVQRTTLDASLNCYLLFFRLGLSVGLEFTKLLSWAD